MNIAYLLLGSNIGDREKKLSLAIEWLEKCVGKVTSKSSIYFTAAWGNPNQPDFLNQAVCIQTPLMPKELMQTILMIEKKLGRKRTKKWGPRLIDIDLLLFNEEIIKTPVLEVPHPFLHERKFALIPLNEIASDAIHPAFQKTICNLLNECNDTLNVVNIRPIF